MASYSAPIISASGLNVNGFPAIINNLVAAYQAIYGPSVYLGADSSDYQFLSTLALQNNDLENGLMAVYLAYGISTAIGPSLDLLGNLLQVPRKPATYSTAVVTVTGTPFINIFEGVAQDTSGNLWNLPTAVSIPSGGSISVTVTAQLLGSVSASAGAISIIATPTLGWTSVTNALAASTGQPVETDSNYRARLIISQSLPSLTELAGTAAALAALYNVGRTQVYENPSNVTQSFGTANVSGSTLSTVVGYPFDSSLTGQTLNVGGNIVTATYVNSTTLTLSSSIGPLTNATFFTQTGGGTALGPPHSISCVVEGSTSIAIANAIYNNCGIGAFTNGSTSVTVTDPNNGGLSVVISYYPLSYTPVFVTLNVHPLVGFTSATQTAIATNLISYLNSLGIGETIVYSELYGAALTARPNPDQPEFSIKALYSGTSSAPSGTVDIPIQYNYASQGISGNIIVNLV